MVVITINIPQKHIDYIKFLTTGKDRIFYSRSELIRLSLSEFLENHINAENKISEELNDFNRRELNKVRIPIENGEYKEYKIIKRLEF